MTLSNSTIELSDACLPLFVGIDVGGTNIKAGLVDERGQTIAFDRVPTDAQQGAEEGVARMAQLVEGLVERAGASREQVVHVGLATPGPLDLESGMLLNPGNLPAWHHFPIRRRLAEQCGRPVRYANDANAAAFGEYWRGAGSQYRSMVMLTLGTGIGGGIILDDLLVEGEHGCGGECGHILVDPSDAAPRDSLGKSGSLEAFCGSYAIVARAEKRLDAGEASRLTELREKGESITPLAIAKAAEASDALARAIVLETADYLGLGIVTLIHTIDPDSVVLGGAMDFGGAGHPLGEAFLQRIRDVVRPRILEPLRETLEIHFARLGGDAGYLGAAGLARLAHRKSASDD